MKLLSWLSPSREQLKIISDTRLGIEVIRGAAGSGKTTTALLRLRNLCDMFEGRLRRTESESQVKVLVLTYNRTLCAYINALAESQAGEGGKVVLQVDTFAGWAMGLLDGPVIKMRDRVVTELAVKEEIKLPPEFLCQEVEYVLGRFPADRRSDYLTTERTGRGASPRVDRTTRQALLKVIDGVDTAFGLQGYCHWEDLPNMVMRVHSQSYDVVIVDEAQDFSANQLRAALYHLAPDHALTLVLDTAQRLYPRGYTWSETGLDPNKIRYYRLGENHRNTIEVAQFAKGILAGVLLDEDGTMPDFDRATRHGDKPTVINGKYGLQLDFAMRYLKALDIKNESVAFLKPKGQRWFDNLRARLKREGIMYEEITRIKEWPDNDTNIILSTMHSAKGLEFDHVICLGLNAQVTSHGDGEDDDQLVTLRRLLAMAVSRARKSVIVGYKGDEASDLLKYFNADTYQEIQL